MSMTATVLCPIYMSTAPNKKTDEMTTVESVRMISPAPGTQKLKAEEVMVCGSSA